MKLKKKKNFLLLEVLLAFTLVVLCILPLVHGVFNHLLEKKKNIEEVEIERLATLAFAEVKLLLHQKKIPWEKIPKNKKETKNFPLTPLFLSEDNASSKPFLPSFRLWCKNEKEGEKEELFRLIEVEISFPSRTTTKQKKPYIFHYQVFAQALPVKTEKE